VNRNCRCGGRLVPNSRGSRLVARFVCDKCGDVRTQRKRLPASAYADSNKLLLRLDTALGALQKFERDTPIAEVVEELIYIMKSALQKESKS
jgi:hypothetical protein